MVKKILELVYNHFPNSDIKIIEKFALSRTLHRMKCIARKLANDRLETLRARRKKLEFEYSTKPASQKVAKKPINLSLKKSHLKKENYKMLQYFLFMKSV